MTDRHRAPTSRDVFRRPLRAVLGVASVAVLLVGIVAPVAAALESTDDVPTDTQTTTETTTDSTTETLEDSTSDPSPSPSITDTSGETIDGTTGTLEDTTDEVVATAEETVDDTTDLLLAEEEPSGEPSEEDPTEDPSQETDEDDQQGTTSDQGDEGSGQDFDDPGEDPSQGQRDSQVGQSDPQADRSDGEGPDVAAMRAAEYVFDSPAGRRLRDQIPQDADAPSSPPRPVIPEGLRANPFVADGAPLATGERSTVEIFDRLRALGAEPAVMVGVLAPFPVMGPASYGDDWLAPRTTPTPHRHKGTDIFAMRGTPVIAVTDGTITRIGETPVGGKIVYLTAADGTYYYYAHLDGFALGLHRGQEVTAGTLLGFVGNTGNAITTPPHLHFEVHPRGGGAVPPVPQLDGWLADARERLAELEAAYTAGGGASDVALTPLVAPRLDETAQATARSLETTWAGEKGLSNAAEGPGATADPKTELISAEVDVGGALWLVALTAAAAIIGVRMRRRTPAMAPSRDLASASSGPPDPETPLTLDDLLSGFDSGEFDDLSVADLMGEREDGASFTAQKEPVGHTAA